MLYPQNGSIAIGSRRTRPTAPAAAAVVSEAIVAPKYTPWFQSNDRADRDAFAFLDVEVERGVIAYWRGEAAVGVRRFFF